MILHLDLETHTILEHLRCFAEDTPAWTALVPDRKQTYQHVARVLRRSSYRNLDRAAKGLVRRYQPEGELEDRQKQAARPFRRKYRQEDILPGRDGRAARKHVTPGTLELL